MCIRDSDNATRKIEAIHEKERAAEQRRWEIERREREQQRQLQRCLLYTSLTEEGKLKKTGRGLI